MDAPRSPQDRDRHPSSRYIDRLALAVADRLADDRMFLDAVAQADRPGTARLVRWTLAEVAAELREQDRGTDAGQPSLPGPPGR